MEVSTVENNPIINPDVVLREEFDDWAVLFNPDTADAVGINPIGVEIWKLLDGTRDLSAIEAEVRERFDEVPDTVHDEIDEFVKDLVARNFVSLEGS